MPCRRSNSSTCKRRRPPLGPRGPGADPASTHGTAVARSAHMSCWLACCLDLAGVVGPACQRPIGPQNRPHSHSPQKKLVTGQKLAGAWPVESAMGTRYCLAGFGKLCRAMIRYNEASSDGKQGWVGRRQASGGWLAASRQTHLAMHKPLSAMARRLCTNMLRPGIDALARMDGKAAFPPKPWLTTARPQTNMTKPRALADRQIPPEADPHPHHMTRTRRRGAAWTGHTHTHVQQ